MPSLRYTFEMSWILGLSQLRDRIVSSWLCIRLDPFHRRVFGTISITSATILLTSNAGQFRQTPSLCLAPRVCAHEAMTEDRWALFGNVEGTTESLTPCSRITRCWQFKERISSAGDPSCHLCRFGRRRSALLAVSGFIKGHRHTLSSIQPRRSSHAASTLATALFSAARAVSGSF